MAALANRWRFPMLAQPLDRAADCTIETASRRAGLARADLFRPATAISLGQLQMACMLAAHGIDVNRAAAAHWQELKRADGICARCSNAARCRRWLQWGGLENAPGAFCPNAALFAALAAEQQESPPAGTSPE